MQFKIDQKLIIEVNGVNYGYYRSELIGNEYADNLDMIIYNIETCSDVKFTTWDRLELANEIWRWLLMNSKESQCN
jgi:hypothetical protein